MDQRPSNRHVVCQTQRKITTLHWNIYHRSQPQQTWLSEQGTIGTLYLSILLKTKKKRILFISKSHKIELLSTQQLFPSVLMNQWKSVWTGRESTTISTFTSSNPQEHMCSMGTPLSQRCTFNRHQEGRIQWWNLFDKVFEQGKYHRKLHHRSELLRRRTSCKWIFQYQNRRIQWETLLWIRWPCRISRRSKIALHHWKPINWFRQKRISQLHFH